jgi:hypothetical protein
VIEQVAEALSREEWVSPENQKPETRHLKPIREVP